jgi:DNA-binding CsgD family transcriptional regulator
VAEIETVAAATGGVSMPWVVLRLRALQGSEAEAAGAISSAIEQAGAGAEVLAMHAHWAAAVLYNGLARYEEAAASARQVNPSEPFVFAWVLPELVEAAARGGDCAGARGALDELAGTTQPCANDFALGIEARCRALLKDGEGADHLYREAIDRLGRTRLRPELARAHLLYGEWLRRNRRRIDARDQLRRGLDTFTSIGMEAFAARAGRELLATGETVRKRTPQTRDDLTSQEAQIAQLARDGLSNVEIGARLFISPRTVEYHLHKVFTKLGITSREHLDRVLPGD